MAPEYNMMELMICVASRYLENGKTVAVGTGAPCAAAGVGGPPPRSITFPRNLLQNMTETGATRPSTPTPAEPGPAWKPSSGLETSSLPNGQDLDHRAEPGVMPAFVNLPLHFAGDLQAEPGQLAA